MARKQKKQKYSWVEKFVYGGHRIFLGGKRPDGGLVPLINKWVEGREPNHGQAQDALLFNTLDLVRVDDGDNPEYPDWHPVGGEGAPPFPLIIGDDGSDTLAEHVLRYLVNERYPFVAIKWPATFEEFLPDEEDEDYDEPTSALGGPSGGSASSPANIHAMVPDPTPPPEGPLGDSEEIPGTADTG